MRTTILLVACVAAARAANGQGLEAKFAATRDHCAEAVGDDFRRMPGAVEFLCGKLRQPGAERMLAIDHLQRMCEASAPAATQLLALTTAGGEEGLAAAIAVGNVAPWWSSELRGEAQRVLAARYHARQWLPEAAALSRSWTRAGLAATRDRDAIEAMLVSEDPFQIEFGLHQLEGLEHEAKSLLPVLRELAQRTQWPVGPTVAGRPRELSCSADWTALIQDRLYWAVRRIDPADPAALPFYLQRLAKAPRRLQIEFVQMFGRMGGAAAPAVPAIVELSRSSDSALAREAVTVLGMVGVKDDAVLKRLRELALGADAQMASRAKAALRQLGG